MSRWLWALIGGVVLVAIASLFWTAGNQRNVTPPGSPGPTAIAPAPVPSPPAASPVAREPAPSPPPTPALPTVQEAAAPPAPAPAPTSTPPPAPSPAPAAGQQAATPPAPPRPLETPSPPPPPPAAEAPLPPPAPGPETAEVQGVYAPKSLAQLVGTWAYSAEDCERLFQRRGDGWAYRQPVDKFAQAAIVESTKKILLPSAFCHLPDRGRV